MDFYFIFKDFIYLFLDRGEGREKEGEKHPCVVASRAPPTGHLARNPDTCPDWESNQRPFGSQASAQSTEPHQPGQENFKSKRKGQTRNIFVIYDIWSYA